MPDAPFSSIEAGIDVLIADAVLALLQGDDDLAELFATGGGIVAMESDVFFARDTIKAPLLAVVLAGADEKRVGSVQAADLETLLSLYLFTRQETSTAADGHLRARVWNRVKSLIQTNSGVLELADHTLLNCALTRFQQTNLLGRLTTQGNNVLVSELRALYSTEIDEATREPIE